MQEDYDNRQERNDYKDQDSRDMQTRRHTDTNENTKCCHILCK